jgi:hypothetical protein
MIALEGVGVEGSSLHKWALEWDPTILTMPPEPQAARAMGLVTQAFFLLDSRYTHALFTQR